jgi:hypothetical protein
VDGKLSGKKGTMYRAPTIERKDPPSKVEGWGIRHPGGDVGQDRHGVPCPYWTGRKRAAGLSGFWPERTAWDSALRYQEANVKKIGEF